MTRDNGRHAERGDVQQAPSEGCQSGPKASPEHRSNPSIDEELIERLCDIAQELLNDDMPIDANHVKHAADRLESLLSDRAKLEELLTRVWACRMDAGEGRFVNLAKLRPVIAEIGDALNRSTDR